jgi:tetratricopeptide (TPR) repeat protein
MAKLESIKKYLRFSGLVALGILGLLVIIVVYKWQGTPEQEAPLPYLFKSLDDQQVDRAGKSHVLLLGDRLAGNLSQYLDGAVIKASESLSSPLIFHDWSGKRDSLARSLRKLTQIQSQTSPPYPDIIIYHGSSFEFWEKRFHLKNKKILLQNFKTYNDDIFFSLILTFPGLSKLLYKNPKYVPMAETVEVDLDKYTAQQNQLRMEILFQLYEIELDQMYRMSKKMNSQLVFITSPLNLLVAPREVCLNSTNAALDKRLLKIATSLDEGKYKENINKLKELKEKVPGNAMILYLLGRANYLLGKTTLAKQQMKMSIALDCYHNRASPIFNSIIERVAKKHAIPLINFDDYLNQYLGKNELFLDRNFPQHFFYQQLAKQVEGFLKKSLKI